MFLASAGLVAALVKLAANALATYGQHRAAFRFGDDLRAEIAARALAGGRSQPPSRTIAALVVRIRDAEHGVEEGLLAGARAAAQLVPLAAVLAALSSGLALAGLLALAPFALTLAAARSRFRSGRARAAGLAERLHTGVDELVRHLDLWRTFGSGARMLDELARAGDEAGRATARSEAGRAALSGANEALAAAALVAIVALVQAGRVAIDRGSLVAFATVFFMMYRPLRDLGDARAQVERGAEALTALDALAREPLATPGPDDRAGAQPLLAPASEACTTSPRRSAVAAHRDAPVADGADGRWPTAALEVTGLRVAHGTFATPEATFAAAPGEVVAIVGPTGAGKTTLLRALLGLEPTSEGRVRYGDRELGSAGVGPSERPFAWVPQEPAIVAGSLEDNVTMGLLGEDERATRERARSALQAVGAGPLFRRRGEARLEAGGAELSGGERQWVAIARAIASGQPVLLLDEPTSGLDAEAEGRVLATLAALRGSRTMILVTHRPEPLGLADKIVRVGGAMLGEPRPDAAGAATSPSPS